MQYIQINVQIQKSQKKLLQSVQLIKITSQIYYKWSGQGKRQLEEILSAVFTGKQCYQSIMMGQHKYSNMHDREGFSRFCPFSFYITLVSIGEKILSSSIILGDSIIAIIIIMDVDLPGGFAVGSGRVWGAKRWLPPNIGKVRIHPSNRPEPNIEQAQILKLPGSYIFRGSGGRNPRRKTIENFVDYGRLNPYITIMKSNNRRGSSHLGVLLLDPRGYVCDCL